MSEAVSAEATLKDETVQAIEQLHQAIERTANSSHWLTHNQLTKVLEYVELAADVVNKGEAV